MLTSMTSSETSLSMQYEDHDNRSTLLQLPSHTQRKLVMQIDATVHSVLASMAGDSPSNVFWRPKGEKNGVAYYIDDSVASGQKRFCCVVETSASAADVIRLFVATDTSTFLQHSRVVYNNLQDARVLSILEAPTPERPFRSVYLRYSSYAAPALLGDRDLSLLVATDVITHNDGVSIGYCLWDSVDLPECPETHGRVRSRMFRSGFFCHSVRDGETTTTTIVYLVGMEPRGVATPGFAAWLLMEKFGRILTRLCQYFRRQHLDPSSFRPRAEWPSARTATQCHGCATQWRHRWRSRCHCVACGYVFCKACHANEDVDLPGVGITTVAVCFTCLQLRGLDLPLPIKLK